MNTSVKLSLNELTEQLHQTVSENIKPVRGKSSPLNEFDWTSVLTFDSVTYTDDLRRRLLNVGDRHWSKMPGESNVVNILFCIAKDGSPFDVRILGPVEVRLAERAVSLIREAGPFRPILHKEIQQLQVETF